MNDDKQIMGEEIRKRLEDDSWDFRIAGNILKKRSERRFRFISGISLSSLAVAASIFIIMSAVFNSTEESLRYNTFISQQIHGTYQSVFVSSQAQADYSPDDDLLSMQSIDSTIDEALSLR